MDLAIDLVDPSHPGGYSVGLRLLSHRACALWDIRRNGARHNVASMEDTSPMKMTFVQANSVVFETNCGDICVGDLVNDAATYSIPSRHAFICYSGRRQQTHC